MEDLMNSLSKKYERLGVLPSELGIHLALPVPTQAPSQILGRKRKIQELEHEHPENGLFFKDIFGDEAFQRMSDMHKVDFDTLLTYLVMASNVNTPANQRFFLALSSLIESYTDKKKLKSKRVKLEAVGYSLNRSTFGLFCVIFYNRW
ncbi:hypothetical protein Tco_0478714 [Tanacetum coccineum]